MSSNFITAFTIVAVLLGFGGVAALLLRHRNTRHSPKGATCSTETVPPRWEDIQSFLPPGWTTLHTLPLDYAGGRLRKVESPFAQALVRGVVDAAPSLSTALQSAQLFKMVGPPAAFDGMAAGTLDWVRDGGGGQLGTLRGTGNTFRVHARFEPFADRAQSAAVAACMFQVLSVATAQHYLHRITAQLAGIAEGVQEIVGKLMDQRFGKLSAAQQTVAEIHAGVLNTLSSGGLLQRIAATNEFWSRMATAEQALREVIGECESDYSRNRERWRAKCGKRQSTGTWVREKLGKRDEIALWEDVNRWTVSVGTIHLAAMRAMLAWYELTLTHDSMMGSTELRARYEAMTEFIGSRTVFFDTWWSDGDFFLAQEGTAASDAAKDLAAAFFAGLTFGLGGYAAVVAAETDERHQTAGSQLASGYNEFRGQLEPFTRMLCAMGEKQTEFLLQAHPSPHETTFAMYVAED